MSPLSTRKPCHNKKNNTMRQKLEMVEPRPNKEKTVCYYLRMMNLI